MRQILSSGLALLLVLCLQSGAAGQEWQPFSVDDMAALLSAGVTPRRLVTLIELHGVNFELTEEARVRLRQAGADAAVLKAVEQAKLQPAQQEPSGQAQTAPPSPPLPRTESDSADMVLVPAGEFWMGCNERVDTECDSDEKPGRTLFVDAFHIDRTEVTVEQYSQCVDAGVCSSTGLSMPYWSAQKKAHPDWAWACNWDKPGHENHPINCVTWQQAQTYCQGVGKRLPTEAEWEKAARGTDGRKYPWGNRDFKLAGRVANIADATAKRNRLNWVVATWYDDGFYETAPIGSFPSGVSPYGALDMSGNVWEWTADWYDSERRYRSLRGGSWSDLPRFARTSSRLRNAPGDRYMVVGFRCVQ